MRSSSNIFKNFYSLSSFCSVGKTLTKITYQLRTVKVQSQKKESTYSQRAINPSKFTQQILINQLKQSNKTQNVNETIDYYMHPLRLYQSKVLPFDYDYFMWASYNVIVYQREIQLTDILLIMKLSKQYQINHKLFWQHFQNQLLWRVQQGPMKRVQQDQNKIHKTLQKSIQILANKSQDLFDFLTEEEKANQLKQQQTQNNDQKLKKINSQKSKQQIQDQQQKKHKKAIKKQILAQKRKDVNFSDDLLIQFSEILVWHGSKNYQLMIDMIQILTLSLQNQKIENIVKYTKFLTHICISYISQYNENKQLYTPRTVKTIYKIQSFYYEQLTPILIKRIQSFDKGQLLSLIESLTMFPIKKRIFRRKIGPKLIEQMHKLGIQRDIVEKYTRQICRKDHKMLSAYKQQIVNKYGQQQQQAFKSNQNQSIQSEEIQFLSKKPIHSTQ